MKKWMISFFIFVVLGCASVEVKAPKDPIKVDIAMRVDIYQHVANDINEIENLVSGDSSRNEQQSFWGMGLMEVYAQDSISLKAEEAALRRKERRPRIVSLESGGVVGENLKGFVEIRQPSPTNQEVQKLLNDENNDRMVIYQEISRKNGAKIQDVQKIYSQRIYSDAPTGTPLQVEDSSGSLTWRNK